MRSAIYQGWVEHRRKTPVTHSFRYPIALAYLDLDELSDAFAQVPRWLCSTKHWSLLQWRRQDYLGPTELPLAQAVRGLLRSRGYEVSPGPIRLLTQLRQVGYVFNPVSFYYCFDVDERLEMVIAEVNNTPWNERHWYVLKNGSTPGEMGFERVPKEFHVSPFMDMDLQYSWQLQTPGADLHVGIENHCRGNIFFDVEMQLTRREWSAANLFRMLVGHPLQPQCVMLGIYWQAFRLWSKKVPYFPHPVRSGTKSLPPERAASANSTVLPDHPTKIAH